MTLRGRVRVGDRGASLLELLISVTLMGLAVVAIVGGLGVGLKMSDIHRKQATAGAEVRSFAETVENFAASGAPTPGYVTTCTNPGSVYEAQFTPKAPGYTRSVTALQYWTGSAWSTSCSADVGMQKLTLSVSSTDGRAAESVDVIVRKPCKTGQTTCS